MQQSVEDIIRDPRVGALPLVARAGSYLAMQDDELDVVYFVVSGLVKLFRSEAEDRELLIGLMQGGELLGELEFFLDIPLYCHMQCVYETRLLVIGRDAFARLIDENPQFRFHLLRSLSTRLHQSTARASDAVSHSMDELFLKLHRENQRRGVRFTRRMYADYLGVSERSVNRAVRRLRDTGRL